MFFLERPHGRWWALLGIAALMSAWTTSAVASTPADSTSATSAVSRLRFYLECSSGSCDFEFLKQELQWVDWVRDRQDAEVHVLLTQSRTGGGGLASEFFVTRPHGGGPAADTVRAFSEPSTSDDAQRRQMLRTLAAILARDVTTRPEGSRLDIHLANAAPSGNKPAVPAKDPWNSWVLKLSGNGFVNGQKSFRSLNAFGNASAARVVPSSKVGVNGFYNYNEQRFTDPRLVFVQRGWGGNARSVWSMGPRWAAGGRAFANSSRFSNLHLSLGAGPALEYDVFPYTESSRHLLTLAYEVTARRTRYDEVTLYGKTSETLWSHGVTAKLAFTQPWGSVSLTPDFSQYLHDAGKYRVSGSTDAQLNLVRGLSLNLSLFAARIRDQLSLPRGDASNEDVLLQQRQLATSFQYFGSVGISYTFGSRTNNVVNVRLDEVYGRF